jgi:hypothetical protein
MYWYRFDPALVLSFCFSGVYLSNWGCNFQTDKSLRPDNWERVKYPSWRGTLLRMLHKLGKEDCWMGWTPPRIALGKLFYREKIPTSDSHLCSRPLLILARLFIETSTSFRKYPTQGINLLITQNEKGLSKLQVAYTDLLELIGGWITRTTE